MDDDRLRVVAAMGRDRAPLVAPDLAEAILEDRARMEGIEDELARWDSQGEFTVESESLDFAELTQMLDNDALSPSGQAVALRRVVMDLVGEAQRVAGALRGGIVVRHRIEPITVSELPSAVRDRLLHLVGSISTYGNVSAAAQPFLTELQTMVGMGRVEYEADEAEEDLARQLDEWKARYATLEGEVQRLHQRVADEWAGERAALVAQLVDAREQAVEAGQRADRAEAVVAGLRRMLNRADEDAD